MTTFDRYLLRSFFYVYFVIFLSTFGLRIIIDLLENIDEFLQRTGGSTPALIWAVTEYYGYQAFFYFDMAGPILMTVSVMVVLILYQSSGELYPLLAAGVPTYRVVVALIFAAGGVTTLLALNQELVIPRIAHQAYQDRGGKQATAFSIEPAYDYSTRISLSGQQIILADRKIEQPQFVLPALITQETIVLKGSSAEFRPASTRTPAGWLISDATPAASTLRLTEAGQQIVRVLPKKNQVFVATPITCDQLFKRSSSYTMQSTRELIQRMRSPAFGAVSSRRIEQHIHSRLTQPLLNLVSVLIAIPLMVRRESPGLVADSGLCGLTLAALFGVAQCSLALGKSGLLAADLAAWIPVISGGVLAAWCSGWIKT